MRMRMDVFYYSRVESGASQEKVHSLVSMNDSIFDRIINIFTEAVAFKAK